MVPDIPLVVKKKFSHENNGGFLTGGYELVTIENFDFAAAEAYQVEDSESNNAFYTAPYNLGVFIQAVNKGSDNTITLAVYKSIYRISEIGDLTGGSASKRWVLHETKALAAGINWIFTKVEGAEAIAMIATADTKAEDNALDICIRGVAQ